MPVIPRASDMLRGVFRRRSSRWPAVERHHLMLHPACAACGGREKVQAHHIIPFHVAPDRELDPTNLLSLCETKAPRCHLEVGHHGAWRRWNPDAVKDAAEELNLRVL